MVRATSRSLSLAEFWAIPQGGQRCELVAGEAIPKMAPKRFHSRTQRALLRRLEAWGDARGEVGLEWSVLLQREGEPWVPIPDLLYVARDRLPPTPLGDEPCPVPPDLAVEIISPEQTFGQMVAKATDYLAAGVGRVWIVDPRAQSITVFAPAALPVTYQGDRALRDETLPGLVLTARDLFVQAGLSESCG